MPTREDTPDIRYWTSEARLQYPELSWAIREIDVVSSLDDVCVELDAITGQTAISIRSRLLHALSVRVSRYPYTDVIYEISQGGFRLAVWCVVQRIPRYEDDPFYQEQAINRILAWCHGENLSLAEWTQRASDFFIASQTDESNASFAIGELMASIRNFYRPNPTNDTVRGPLVRAWERASRAKRMWGDDDEPDLATTLQRFPVVL